MKLKNQKKEQTVGESKRSRISIIDLIYRPLEKRMEVRGAKRESAMGSRHWEEEKMAKFRKCKVSEILFQLSIFSFKNIGSNFPAF